MKHVLRCLFMILIVLVGFPNFSESNSLFSRHPFVPGEKLTFTLQQEGNHKRDIMVNFDWEKQQAQYTDRGKTRNPIPLAEGSLDSLSALYFTRLANMHVNKAIIRPVTDGKKNTVGMVTVLKREMIEVSDVTYDTFLVEPDTKDIGGVFKKSDDAKIYLWFTADERRIPVKIKNNVAVGSFVGELISIFPY